ncbi:hypothetical protein RYX36_011918 [Vicia faba]
MATRINTLNYTYAILCILVVLASGQEANFPPICEEYCCWNVGPEECNIRGCLNACSTFPELDLSTHHIRYLRSSSHLFNFYSPSSSSTYNIQALNNSASCIDNGKFNVTSTPHNND